jgi:hypothetical protein
MRLTRRLKRGSASLVLSALGGFVALSLAVAAPHAPRVEGIELALSDAAGSLSLTNSLGGSAILGAANMRPGDQSVGTVRIGNDGTVPAALRLQASNQGSTSPAGGSMWSRLQIAIADTTDAQHPIGLYNGPLASLAQISAGALPAGQQHEFRFIATLPDGAPIVDNAYQGAGSTVLFTWTATGEEIVTPTPTPAPVIPVIPVTPTPVPAPTPQQDVRDDNANSPSADGLLKLPSSKRCLSARKFTIHLRKKKGVTVRNAVVYVNGKTKVKVQGKKKLRAAINLRGLPAGQVKVKIVLTTTKGGKLVSTRTYKTCKAKPLTKAQQKKAKALAKARAKAKAKKH